MRLAIDSTRHRGFGGRSPKSQAGGELALIRNDLRRDVDGRNLEKQIGESGAPGGLELPTFWFVGLSFEF